MDSSWLIGCDSGKAFLDQFGEKEDKTLEKVLEINSLILSRFPECDRFIYQSKTSKYCLLVYGRKEVGKNGRRGIKVENDKGNLCIYIGNSKPYKYLYVEDNMEEVAQFISEVADTVSKNMNGSRRRPADYQTDVDGSLVDQNNYLITWNPERYKIGGDGSDEDILPYRKDERVEWKCSNSAAKVGDLVYLIRLGQEPRGVIATGTITKSAWKSEEGFRIEFEFNELRQSAESGMLPMVLLKSKFPAQKWSPQSSGVLISTDTAEELDGCWQDSEGLDSLNFFLEYCLANSTYSQRWKEKYQRIIRRIENVIDGDFDEKLLKDIWYTRSNGVSSLKQGLPSEKEFRENIEFLKGLTSDISHNSTPEMLTEAHQRWQDSTFNKTYWSAINRAFSAIHPTVTTSIISDQYLYQVIKVLREQFQLEFEIDKNWFSLNQNLIEALSLRLNERWNDYLDRNIALWCICDELNKEVVDMDNQSEAYSEDVITQLPTNSILYGPPGTGKTYSTIYHAVKSADPEFDGFEDRTLLKARYDKLLADGRIRFTTFHQSFAYEDFVEGIRSKTKANQLKYSVCKGIFRKISDAARSSRSPEVAFNLFKEWLADGNTVQLKTSGGRNDFELCDIPNSDRVHIKLEADSVDFQKKERAIGISDIYQVIDCKNVALKSYSPPLVKHLKDNFGMSDKNDQYVLIIDEINRGNISKIFGELITLIEPSKREGQPEALSVTLPYSKDRFSVPPNLHIIGTMNTADRSLALIDTALRRRFDFIEMMPDYSLLKGKKVRGIDLKKMLEKINQRIEYLYDREHTIGHAFFMPVVKLIQDEDEEAAFSTLFTVFKNKILPLLEEYFYEDWQRIALVLGDNQKSEIEHQFVVKKTDQNADSLFGKNHQLQNYGEEKVSYQLNPKMSEAIPEQAFIGIYDAASVKPKSADIAETQGQAKSQNQSQAEQEA